MCVEFNVFAFSVYLVTSQLCHLFNKDQLHSYLFRQTEYTEYTEDAEFPYFPYILFVIFNVLSTVEHQLKMWLLCKNDKVFLRCDMGHELTHQWDECEIGSGDDSKADVGIGYVHE